MRTENRLKSNNKSALWISPLSIWMIIFYVIPLIYIIITSFNTMVDYKLVNEYSFDNYLVFFKQPLYQKALLNSIWLAVRVVLITTVVAYPLAIVLVYVVPKKWHTFFLVLIIAPFWTSYLIRAYSWFIVLGNTGVVNSVLKSLGLIKEPIAILYTTKATIIGLVHYLLPIMTLTIYTTLENIDVKLLEAADDMGANTIQKFTNIILPLSSGGLSFGMMFIFILAFADYISASTLGGQADRVFPQIIVDAVQWNINWPLAAALSIIMVFVIFVFVGLISLFRNIGNLENGGSGK